MQQEVLPRLGSRGTEERREAQLAVLAVLLAGASLLLYLAVEDPPFRLRCLSGFLLILATAEGYFGVSQVLRPGSSHPGPDAVYATQHVGIYNLFAALLYVFAALDPVKNIAIVWAVITLYAVHAGYELACYLGLAPLGESFRPKRRFLLAAITLLAVIAPVIVFHP